MLIFYKSVDKSLLTEGFNIPIKYMKMLFEHLGFTLKHGEKRQIEVLIDNIAYKAILKNIDFKQENFPTHKDILQIRYGKNSPLAIKLREKYGYTSKLISDKADTYNYKWLSSLPEKEKEFMAIYTTNSSGVIMADCITNKDFKEEISEIAAFDESLAERILDGTDLNCNIVLKTKVCKIRRLTTTILKDLKELYGYRCQICGQYIGANYASNLIHAHHIEYFTKSLNNNADNIMILCPNHHGIIHDRNPEYNKNDKTYRYPNGYSEGLMLNYHL